MSLGSWWNRRDRAPRPERGFLPEWRGILAVRVRHWGRLSDDERSRLEDVAHGLMLHKGWEASRGFELTDEMVVTIAGQAALLVLELPDDSYRRVRNILVHPSTVILRGEHSHVPGIVSDDPTPVLGEAHYDGQVLIAWDAALRDTRRPGSGHNVVLHEFAHQLDMIDGTVDGTPPLESRDQYERWVRVCTDVYDRVAAGVGGSVLDEYAGVNPGEFFAVATEVFFDAPLALRDEHPDLYEVLSDYYRQDTAARAE